MIYKQLTACFIMGAMTLAATETPACVQSITTRPIPPPPPPTYWIENRGFDVMTNKVTYDLGIEVDLFPPTSATTCACGLEFTVPPPNSLFVVDAYVGITNTETHETTALPEFEFEPNPVTSTGLGNAFAGTWSGFSASVAPFTPPTLNPNEVFKAWYTIEIDAGDVPYLSSVSTAAGEALPSGEPITEGDHPTVVIEPQDTFAAFLNCDFDGDNGCDIQDIDALVTEIVAGTHDPLYDMTGDNLVTLDDIRNDEMGWLSVAGEKNWPEGGSYSEADINLDGVVDGVDFIQWNENKFSSTGLWSAGDLDANGVTDGQDFIIWNLHKFTSQFDSSAAVPEPSALGLLAIGMTTLLRRRAS